MIVLTDARTDEPIGRIADSDLRALMEAIDEEAEADTSYRIEAVTVDRLEEDGASDALVSSLRDALRDRDAVEIRWSPE
jgi:hypothetical protein